MFLKSLLISILIHLLILSWAGSSLPFLTKRTKAGSSPERQLEYRTITLVELPPPAGAREERPAHDRSYLTKISTEKTVKQADSYDRLPLGTHEVLPSSPVEAPVGLSPFLTGSAPEATGKLIAPAQTAQPGKQGFKPSSQDRPMDSSLPLEVAAEAAGEIESEADQAENSIPTSASVPANEATATWEEAQLSTLLSSGERALCTGFAPSPASGSSGDSSIGDPSVLPTKVESASASGPVKIVHTDPVYPRLARRRGWEGTVYLAVRITPEGEVRATEIIQSSGYELLDQAAVEAVSQWRYAWPGGQLVADGETITVKIRFQLEE